MKAWRCFAIALSFLTRLPLPLPLRPKGVREAEWGPALSCFPAVGLLLGLVLVFAWWFVRGHISEECAAVGLVALLAALTGGLHLDGVADVFDGLAGSHGNRQRMLRIMRDNRLGALGGTAVLLVVLAKVFGVLSLLHNTATWALCVFPLVARLAVCPLLLLFPYAREEGLGSAFTRHGRTVHCLYAALMAGGVLLVAGLKSFTPALAACAVALGMGVWLQRRLGGLTGDVYGAAIECAEVTFLFVASGPA